ncbi:MAG: glycosyltransferase [Myxococcota bacterium]|nr:glycosyltransferase [Myxococcota bacterium]
MTVKRATVRDAQSAEYIKSLALAEDRPEEALELWSAARHLDPTNRILLNHYAYALFDLNRHREVVELVSEHFLSHSRLSHFSNVFAASLCRLGYYREGLDVLRHLTRLDPDYPNASASMREIARHLSKANQAPRAVTFAVAQGIQAAQNRKRPTLAVCMIVKDEEEFIVDAIRSVRGVADQVVVIDTGSTDRTVELAKSAGAEVGFFEWVGDFSAARNASLDAATMDWVLVLDADERLAEDSKTALRAVLEECDDPDDLRVVCVRIKNYTRDGHYMSDGFSGRLFRRDPSMRFEGRVHEEVARGRADVSTDYRLDLCFDHYGADPEVMKEKAKDERNIELLESRLLERPDDLLTWFYLASQHWVARRKADANKAFRRVVELFERNPSAYGVGVRNVPVPYSYVGLIRGLIDSGRAQEGVHIARRGLARFPENPDLAYQAGLAHVHAGELEPARDAFVRASSIKISGYGLIGMHDKSIQAWRAPKMLADLDFEAGDHQSAYTRYWQILPNLPDAYEESHVVAARMVELAAELGDFDRLADCTYRYLTYRPGQVSVALQVASKFLAANRQESAWVLLDKVCELSTNAVQDASFLIGAGQLAEAAGDDQRALGWYERVVNLGHQDPRFWLGLAQLFSRNGAMQQAQEAVEVAQAYVRNQQTQ